MYYLAYSDVEIGTEIPNANIVSKLEDVYTVADEGLPVYEVHLLSKPNNIKIMKKLSDKELRKGLEKRYKKLDIAIMFNDLATVKKIYALKTPVKRSSEYSLSYATKNGNLNIIKCLIDNGEIDLESYYTLECLEIASECGHLDLVKYFLKLGINPCMNNFYPLIWARKKGYNEIVSLLEKEIKKRLGKLPEIKDPYEVLMEKQKTEIVEPIVEEEVVEKPKGRGAVVAKVKKLPKKKEEPKKKSLSLEELKARSAKLLKKEPVKESKKVKKKTTPKKEVVKKKRGK